MRKSVVTTILTPATSRDMTQLATVKDDWGVTGTADDGFLGRAITRCSSAAEQFCNRSFAMEEVQDRITSSCGASAQSGLIGQVDALQLSRWPVAAVASVVVDGQTLAEGTDFITDAKSGQLLRIDGAGDARHWGGRLTVAVYTAGYVLPGQDPATLPAAAKPLPPDLEDAVGRMVFTRYSERQRDPLVKSETLFGVMSTDYLTPSADGNLSPDVLDILDNYRVPVIG